MHFQVRIIITTTTDDFKLCICGITLKLERERDEQIGMQ